MKFAPCSLATVAITIGYSSVALGTAGTSDQRTSAGLQPATPAVNALGLDLLSQAFPTGNALLSPYSIQLSLAMAYGGAAGRTLEEMRKTLHYPKSEAALFASFAELQHDVSEAVARSERTRQRATLGDDGSPIIFLVANQLFAERSLPIKQPFLQLLKDFFGVSPELLDFRGNPFAATEAINVWFANHTRQHIQSVVPADSIDHDTKITLANAVYFRGDWQKAFSESETLPRPFHVKPGLSVDVPMMKTKYSFGYDELTGGSLVTLPFTGGELQLILIIPWSADGLASLERKITPSVLARAAHAQARPVVLYMPKFRAEPSAIDLMRHLSMLGMHSAGSYRLANFSRITDNPRIHLEHVFHKSRMIIEERGAEATSGTAAVLSAGLSLTAPERAPKIVKADRPFLFAVQHRSTGACIFLGRILDPR